MEAEKQPEKRLFPRIPVNCPVLYRIGKRHKWLVAKLLNFSATGLQMLCADSPPLHGDIVIHIKPGTRKTIPEVVGHGKIIRVESVENGQYRVSAKLRSVGKPHRPAP